MPNFSIAVLSDLHMHNGPLHAVAQPSVLTSDPAYSAPNQHPVKGAAELLKGQGLQPDWILCPGDLGDKADIAAQSSAWAALENLRQKIHARKLIGTVGNHDVDSRGTTGASSPTGTLRTLDPPFPIRDTSLWNKFWASNYAIYVDRRRSVRLVVIDSCMFHTHTDPALNKIERERGRISDRAIAELQRSLGGANYKVNILMLHHHIRQHPFALSDNSFAIGGSTLLEILKETHQNWFVLHGHQHAPDLRYAEGGANPPLVFSAGSAAATTWAMRGVTPRNQLYFVEFELPEQVVLGAEVKGTIRAWDWTPFRGWEQALRNSGLPSQCGFGFRGSIATMVSDISKSITARAPSRMRWEELCASIPDVRFLIPSDMDLLIQLLSRDGIAIDYDIWGFPSQFERRSV